MRLLRAVALLLSAGFLGPLPAAASPRSPLAISPFRAVTDYAAKHGVPVAGIAFTPENGPAQPGDEVVHLLELQQPGMLRQWLVRITAGDPGLEKGRRVSIPDDTIHTSTGLELRYTNTPAVLEVEFIGPFEDGTDGGTQAVTRRGRAVVSAESLEVGLGRYCESSLGIAGRLKEAGIEKPVYYGVGRPLKPEAIASGRQAAAVFGLTPEEERLAFSVYFALRSFYQAAAEIPTCRDVLEPILQKPSLWSVAGNLGVHTNFEYGWQMVRVLDSPPLPLSAPVHVLPVRLALNGQPALQASLAVTDTRPPLRNSAGIVALVAEHPTDGDRRLFLRLLAARPARR